LEIVFSVTPEFLEAKFYLIQLNFHMVPHMLWSLVPSTEEFWAPGKGMSPSQAYYISEERNKVLENVARFLDESSGEAEAFISW